MKKHFLFLTLFAISCSQPETEQKTINKVTARKELSLAQYLNQLDPAATNAISQGTLYFKTHLSQSSPLNCDSSLVLLKNFSIQSAIAINESGLIPRIANEDGDISAEDRQKFKRIGLLIKYVDNEPYFIADPQYLFDACKNCLSVPMTEFMTEFIIENREMKQRDEFLDLSAEELKRRILFWEKFLTDYPDFILDEEAHITYGFYFSQYVTGSKTAKVFINTGYHLTINQQFKSSYELLMKQHPGLQTTSFISSYYQFLKENDWTYNKRVEHYLDSVVIPFSVNQ